MARNNLLDLNRHLPSFAFVAVSALLIAGAAGAIAYAGVYNIGADAPHSSAVYWALDGFRNKAIEHHARGIVYPPDLDEPKRIASGAGLYAEMCSGCHLAPGMAKTDLSQGLYPQAPELSRSNTLPKAQQFWIIKHGIKLSAMPAWGRTHSDALIWDMVAFLDKLPTLSPAQYSAAVKAAPSDSEAMMAKMPGMAKAAN